MPNLATKLATESVVNDPSRSAELPAGTRKRGRPRSRGGNGASDKVIAHEIAMLDARLSGVQNRMVEILSLINGHQQSQANTHEALKSLIIAVADATSGLRDVRIRMAHESESISECLKTHGEAITNATNYARERAHDVHEVELENRRLRDAIVEMVASVRPRHDP